MKRMKRCTQRADQEAIDEARRDWTRAARDRANGTFSCADDPDAVDRVREQPENEADEIVGEQVKNARRAGQQ